METPRNTEAAPRDGPEEQRQQRGSDAHGIGRLAIYAASLTDYNNGILHGAWIDADEDEERMQGEVDSMLARSPTTKRHGEVAEEWAIHDYEGFEPLRLDENVGLGTVARLAGGILEHGRAFAAWANWNGSTGEETLGRFEEAYLGEWPSVEGYAEDILDDFGIDETLDRVIPDGLRPYVQIDGSGFARDLEIGGSITSVEKPGGGVWVFDATG